MAEGAPLLRAYRLIPIEGSNPSLSAIFNIPTNGRGTADETHSPAHQRQMSHDNGIPLSGCLFAVENSGCSEGENARLTVYTTGVAQERKMSRN